MCNTVICGQVLIDTFDRHSDQYTVNTWLTVDQHSVNNPPSVDWLLTVDRLTTKTPVECFDCQPRRQWSVNQAPIKCQSGTYQVSIKHLSSFNQAPIKCQSGTYQVSIKHLSSVNQAPIKCQSSTYQVSIRGINRHLHAFRQYTWSIKFIK